MTKEIGAKWDVGRIAKFPKVVASLPIREADNHPSRQIVATSFPIATTTFPYAAIRVYLVDISSTTQYFGVNNYIVNGSSDETAFVAALNADAAAQGWAGTVSASAGSLGTRILTWTNGAGDLFVTGGIQIFFSPLVIQLTTTNVAQAITFSSPNLIVDYGDGTTEVISSAASNVPSTLHTYGSSGTHTIQIFGSYTTIAFDDGYLHTVTGEVPGGLLFFILKNSFTMTAFDCTVLSNANSSLTILGIFSCSAFTTISNFSTLTLLSIQVISFAVNALSGATCSSIVSDVDTAVINGASRNGGLYINGQNAPLNNGTLNMTALLARYDLVMFRGWNVKND
jgi:hypothetical protein